MMKKTMNYNVISDCRGMYEEEIIETILNKRGIQDPEHFLNPTEDDLLPLDIMKNIDEAARMVSNAINHNLNISVLADTDLDGITAGTIMTRFLKQFTDKIHTFINKGKTHGLLRQDNERFEGTNLLIIVDSLDDTIDEYAKLCKKMQIIVLDHHAINPEIPYDDYVTLVSSQRNYNNLSLSGAGVVWKFCKYIEEAYLDEDYADELIDLAACGIVADMCDVSEMSMENRYIVKTGLENMRNPAIKKIVGSFPFNSTAVSFSIAPLVNAANRVNQNEAAMKAFLADDNKEVLKCVKELKKCKEFQNEEVERLMPEVIRQCEEQKEQKMIVVFIDTEYGISGLFGNKLLEKYQRPILVLKDCGDMYAGSMRAIGIDDFRKFCNDSGLAQADGHELASGIMIKKENLSAFQKYVEINLVINIDSETKNIDIELDISDITRTLIDKVKILDKVSGTGFKPVSVKVSNITEYEIGNMSQEKHLIIKPLDYLQFIKWNWTGSFDDMEDAAIMEEPITVCGSLDSGWLGRTFSLKVICDSVEVG